MKVVCNARVLQSKLTGVQRYTQSILNNISNDDVMTLAPTHYLRRPLNLLWEQFVLPLRLPRGMVLWSPANTGPFLVRNQVLTVHDIAPVDFPSDYSKAYRYYQLIMLSALLRTVKKIIAVSNFTKSRLIEYYKVDERRVEVVYNGIDHSHFYPRGTDEVAIVRGKYGLSKKYVLYVGTISPRKNLSKVVEAWSGLPAVLLAGHELVIAGDLGLSHVFRSGVGELSGEQFRPIGRVPDEDLPALITGAIGFIYTSLYEGFGLPPLEALACGTPCITSSTTSLGEVVGDAAIKTLPEDADATRQALVRLLTDEELRLQLRAAGLERAKLFDWKTTAERTRKILTAAAP